MCDLTVQHACRSLAELAALLAGLERDTASPLIAELKEDCRILLDGCSAAPAGDVLRRLAALQEALCELTATNVPTADELRLRAVGEQLGQIAAGLPEILAARKQARPPGPTT